MLDLTEMDMREILRAVAQHRIAEYKYLSEATESLALIFRPCVNMHASKNPTTHKKQTDLFEDVDRLSDIAFNVPKNKFGASVQYLNPDLELGMGLGTRFVAGSLCG